MNHISQLGYDHGRENANYQNYWTRPEDRKLYDWGYKIGYVEWERDKKIQQAIRDNTIERCKVCNKPLDRHEYPRCTKCQAAYRREISNRYANKKRGAAA